MKKEERKINNTRTDITLCFIRVPGSYTAHNDVNFSLEGFDVTNKLNQKFYTLYPIVMLSKWKVILAHDKYVQEYVYMPKYSWNTSKKNYVTC